MRVYNCEGLRVFNAVKSGCNLDLSPNWNPFYGFRFEIRQPKFDPTLVVEATIEAIDRSDG